MRILSITKNMSSVCAELEHLEVHLHVYKCIKLAILLLVSIYNRLDNHVPSKRIIFLQRIINGHNIFQFNMAKLSVIGIVLFPPPHSIFPLCLDFSLWP